MALPDADAWASLEDDLIGPEPEDDTPIPVDGLEQANRELLRLARVERDIASAQHMARIQVEQVTAWRDRRVGELVERADRIRGRLEGFHSAVLADDPKRSTIDLPAGVLKARRAPATWDVEDEAVIEYAMANGDDAVVRVRPPEVDRNAMKAAYTLRDDRGRPQAYGIDPRTGERVPGITIVDGEKVFDQKPRTSSNAASRPTATATSCPLPAHGRRSSN